jgi:hypothetical protein
MDRSAVTLGPARDPARFSGRIQALNDTVMRSLVGSPNGQAVRLRIELTLQGDTIAGRVRGTPVGE